MKRKLVYFGLFLAMVPFAVWKARQAYYSPKVVEAKTFCEALFPKLEATRQRDGQYPRAIDPSWLEGKRIPEFIDPNNFYSSTGDTYQFYFRYSGDFWDNMWGYMCGPGPCKGGWQSYDAN